MSRDIINAPALQEAIEDALERAPSELQGYLPGLRTYLRRAAEKHDSLRKAHRRKNDPSWAQIKFDEDRTLYRFRTEDRDDLIDDIRNQFDELGQVAILALKRSSSISRDATAFLKGLSHCNGEIASLGREAWVLIDRAETAALRAQRYEELRAPAHVSAGSLCGARCVSIEEIARLGREVKNCLAENEDYWKRFAARKIDIWAIRDGGRLVATLEVNRASKHVTEALGPSNATVRLRDVRQVAQFCVVAGFTIGRRCEGLLAGYAAPFVVTPKLVEDGKRMAFYAEWPTAVRIDLSDSAESLTLLGGAETLALSFDPECLCGESAFGKSDPRQEIKRFGRKRVRRIVRAIALGQAAPTLVQHRLLALAA